MKNNKKLHYQKKGLKKNHQINSLFISDKEQQIITQKGLKKNIQTNSLFISDEEQQEITLHL